MLTSTGFPDSLGSNFVSELIGTHICFNPFHSILQLRKIAEELRILVIYLNQVHWKCQDMEFVQIFLPP